MLFAKNFIRMITDYELKETNRTKYFHVHLYIYIDDVEE